MTRDEAKDYIKRHVSIPEQFNLKGKQGDHYICPVCGSGTGPDGSPAFTYYPQQNSWFCYACQAKGYDPAGGDIFTLYQQVNNLPANGAGFADALDALAAQNGIVLDQIQPGTEPKKNLSHYFRECQERLPDSKEAVSYLAGRKIRVETALNYGIGYDPAADPAESKHPSKRIIIPTSADHYVGRAIDPHEKAFAKMNNKGAKPGIWNDKALYGSASAVFVVEGVFDALSIIEAGGTAIALNSASNRGQLIREVNARKPKCKLILCLDNDEAGKGATDALQGALKEAHVPFLIADTCCGKKDQNEALVKCEKRFRDSVQKAISDAQKPDNTSFYLETMFQRERRRASGQIRTGYEDLDKELSGGLYPGLYVVASGTAMGKTTFCLQMADNIASTGNDVLYITLEQSRLELVCKSLSRMAHIADKETGLNALRIRNCELNAQEEAEVQQAIGLYKYQIKDRVSILEGNFAYTVKQIGEAVRGYIERTGRRPVVFVDYLQILRSSEKNQSTKETIDAAITELKTLSRDYSLCVIAISSISRANYQQTSALDALKESGGIEYTADAVFFLQLQVLREDIFDAKNKSNAKNDKIKEAIKEDPRKVQLCCLKNRFGKSSFECDFDYYPKADMFKETVHFSLR